MHGGGHERGMRSGTLPTHQIVGMGEAIVRAEQTREQYVAFAAELRDELWRAIQERIDDVSLNGPVPGADRLPNNLNITIDGVQGETFDYDENREPKWIGPLLSDEPGFNLSDAQGAYFLYNSAGYILFDRETQVMDAESLEFVDIWNLDGTDYYFPGTATMTADENTEYANVMGDINTLISESIVKFVIGEKSFSEYDAFIQEIRKLGIDRAIAARQAALDRYMAR